MAIGGIRDVEKALQLPVNGMLSVVPLIDGAGNLEQSVRRAVGFATDFLPDDEPLFVHCHAGRSRSVVILAMARCAISVCRGRKR